MTVNELAEKIAKAMGVSPEIEHVPARKEVKLEAFARKFNLPINYY